MIGRGVHCWCDNNLLSGVQLWVVLHPSLHLLNLVVDHFSAAGFQGCCFALDWSKIFLMPSYMPLRMPAAAAVWMSLLSSRQHSLPHLLALCCTLLLADLIPWRVFSIGERLFSATEARFVTITGINFSDLASNQSQFFEVLLPKVARADFWIASCRWFHDLEAVLHCFSKCCIMFLSVRGFPKCLKQWSFSGGGLILQHVSERLESQSALWYERVRSTCLELYV